LFLFRALASGSSGNAFLLRTDSTTLLFDAGIRLPSLRKYLASEGVALEDISAVLLSHEHRDHCQAASDIVIASRTPVYANEKVLRATGLHSERSAALLDVGKPYRFGDVEVTTFGVPHDAVCPVGFFITSGERSIVLATDFGSATDEIEQVISLSDLVVLEANHDYDMLVNGRYPAHLRRRVAGPNGHLSNSQAAALLVNRVRDDGVEIWLAHLSKENNTPALALRTVQRALKGVGLSGASVTVAGRDKPSARWTGQPRPRQLELF
jgi:phosphoribosyl 1,2-cyclic phosphodiesterase